MPRKLVTVRRVSAIRPIPGATRIEAAEVGGWTCVVGIKEFAEGDLGVFFEIDSFLPAGDERWAFLEQSFIVWDGATGFRVKTRKMQGQISQGLLLPLAKFPEINKALEMLVADHGKESGEEAIMEIAFENTLGVKKYENIGTVTEVQGQELFLGPIPDFIEKTDQERVQNLRKTFNSWQDMVFQETTKMDGSSMTVYFIRKDSRYFPLLPPTNSTGGKTPIQSNGRLGVCSRNRDLVERRASQFWEIANKLQLPEKLNERNRDVAIQGELCGSSIQSNFEGFPRGFLDFFIFSVWDIDAQRYLPPKEVEQWAADLKVRHVPVHGYRKLSEIAGSVPELLTRAEGTGINGKKREGIVLKHIDGDFSFKAISNSYLLKHGE